MSFNIIISPEIVLPHWLLSADVFCHFVRNQPGGPQAAAFPSQSLMSDPVSNLAMAYGSSLASQGREIVDKNVRLTHQSSKNRKTS